MTYTTYRMTALDAFLAERCEIDDQASVAVVDLYAAWLSWKCPVPAERVLFSNSQALSRALRKRIPDLRIVRPRDPHAPGGQRRCFVGVTLKHPGEQP